VTHALVLQLWIHGAINAFGTHTPNALGDVAHHISKPHFIIAKVITIIRYTIVAPIPMVILIDQESITVCDGALKDCADKIKKEI
jgi:hypothetical protein